MQKNRFHDWPVYLLALILAFCAAVALDGEVSAKDCASTQHADTACEGAEARLPTAHGDPHTAACLNGGGTVWEIAFDGKCTGELEDNCCELGSSNLSIKEKTCTGVTGYCSRADTGEPDSKEICNC